MPPAARSAAALVRASHPEPTVAVTAIATALAVSTGLGLRSLWVAAAFLTGQLSVGWSNDWIDAARDARNQRADKPVGRGLLSVAAVRTAALAALEEFEHGGLIERAREIESLATSRLRSARSEDPRIGDVRGRGAMIAIELVDPVSGEPDPVLTSRVAQTAHAEGVIVLTCGTYGNVIRLLPPLSIGDDLLTEGLDVLLGALAEN